jgi:hypothetical protein
MQIWCPGSEMSALLLVVTETTLEHRGAVAQFDVTRLDY